jgi:RecA-family ATPase
MLIYGDAGAAKTTGGVDLAAHLGSGTDWLGIPVLRPIKVALIQNEGPAVLWQAKLRAKRETWPCEPLSHNIVVLAEPHGGFSLRIAEHREALRELRRQGVELVITDPTKWLGFEGGGTPDQVREFVELLRECGLHSAPATRSEALP